MYDRKQREILSFRKDIEYAVPQGSILGPLLFNIYLCDLFHFLEQVDFTTYADDTTIYAAK